jgi:hypothetical protein
MKTLKLEHLKMYIDCGLYAKMLDYKIDYVGLIFDKIVGLHQWDKNNEYFCVLTEGGSKPSIERILPVLFPLSYYTDINSIWMKQLGLDLNTQMNLIELAKGKTIASSLSFGDIQELCRERIDVFNLIHQNLAVAVTTNFNPYA